LNLEKHYRNINELALLFREEKYGGNAFSKPGPVLLLDDSPQFYAVSCREPVLEIEYLWYTNLRCAGDWRSIVLEAISVKKPAYILVSRREDAVFDAGGLFRETGMIYLRENCREAEKSGMDLFVFRASVVSSGSGEGRAGHGIFNNLPSPSEFSALKQVKFKKLGDHIRADGGDYALFGCGNFTSGLLDYLMGNHIKLPSVIYDDNPSVQEFRTVPVLPASEIKNSAFPVILSSDIFNTRVMMYFSLSRSGCQPGRIKDIYTFLGGKELSFQDE
jgi:hypothetical protein